jgi:transcriptional regulator with XRE-family HTH domain
MNTVEIIRELILKKLDEPKYTETRLASEIGINQGTIAKYIKYSVRAPDIETLLKIAKYFNKPITYFFDKIPEDIRPSPISEEIVQICNKLPLDAQLMILNYARFTFDGSTKQSKEFKKINGNNI